MRNNFLLHKKGFTLVEAVIGSAVFLIIALAAYQGYTTLLKGAAHLRVKSDGLALADEQFEVIRNLPFAEVGTVGGVPAGIVPQSQTLVRDGLTFSVSTVIRNINDPFDGMATDTSPADYKMAQVTVACTSCTSPDSVSLSTWVAPLNLETSSSSGSLFIKVFDASGMPVSGAAVTVQDASASPSILIHDTTDVNGMLEIVGTATGTQAYNIIATKSGYSTDQTYPFGASGNPNPTKPDATVAANTVTQTSLSIDTLGSMSVSAVDSSCNPVGSVPFELTGAKTIGSSPTIYKYDHNLTLGAGGSLSVPSLEWDTYSLGVTGSSYMLAGTNPVFPLALNPGQAQDVQLVVVPKNNDGLLVTVEDSSNGQPISGATVTLAGATTSTQTTSQGFLSQTDWSGGSGQALMSNQAMYSASDGNVDVTGTPGQVSLHDALGTYAPTGWLESSTFDTGTSSMFGQISWLPQAQDPTTGTSSVEFQLASSGSSSPSSWNFIGPDGTSATYYTSANQNISATNNGDRYFRYRMYLSTANSTSTPSVSDVTVTYALSCTPPGQVFWDGLASATYSLSISAPGYQPYTGTVSVASGWQSQVVSLSK